jgi:hypothetical protein
MVEKHAAEKEKRRLELKELRKQGKNRQLSQLRGQTLEVNEGKVPVLRIQISLIRIRGQDLCRIRNQR